MYTDQLASSNRKAAASSSLTQHKQQMNRHDSKFKLAMMQVQNFDKRVVKDKVKRQRQERYHQEMKEINYQKQIQEYKSRLLKQWKSADNNSPIRQFNKNYMPSPNIKVQNQSSEQGDHQRKHEISQKSVLRVQIPNQYQQYQLLTDDTQNNIQNNTNDDQMFILQQNQFTKCGDSLLNSYSDQVSERPLEPIQMKVDTIQSDSQHSEDLQHIGVKQTNANSAVNLQEKSPLIKSNFNLQLNSVEQKILTSDLSKLVEKSGKKSNKNEYRMNLSPNFQIFQSDLLENSEPLVNQSLDQIDFKSNQQYMDRYFPLPKNVKSGSPDDQLDEIIGRKFSNPISELEKANSPDSVTEMGQQTSNLNIQIGLTTDSSNHRASLKLKTKIEQMTQKIKGGNIMKTTPQMRQIKILQDLKKQVEQMNASLAIDNLLQGDDEGGNLNQRNIRESIDLVSKLKKNSISTLIATRPLETVALNNRIFKKQKKQPSKTIRQISNPNQESSILKRHTKMLFHVPSPLEQIDSTEQTTSNSVKKLNQHITQPRIQQRVFKSTDFSAAAAKSIHTVENKRNNEYSKKNNISREQKKSRNKSIFKKIDGQSINMDLNIFQQDSNINSPSLRSAKKNSQFTNTIDQLPQISKEFELKSKNQITELASEDNSEQYTKLGNYSNYSHELKSFSTQNQINQFQQKVGGLFKTTANEMLIHEQHMKKSYYKGPNISNDTITDQNFTSTARENLFTFGSRNPLNEAANQNFLIKVHHKKSDNNLHEASRVAQRQDSSMGCSVGHNQYLNGQMGKFNIDLLRKFSKDQIQFFLGGYKCVQHQRDLAQRRPKLKSKLKNKTSMPVKNTDTMIAARGTQYLLKDHQLLDESCASDSYGKSQKDYFEFEDGGNLKGGNSSIKVNLRAVNKADNAAADATRLRQNSDLGVLLDSTDTAGDQKTLKTNKHRRQSQSNSSIVIQNEEDTKSVQKRDESDRDLSYNGSKKFNYSQKQINEQQIISENGSNKYEEEIKFSPAENRSNERYMVDEQRQTPKSTLFNSPAKAGMGQNVLPQIIQFGYTSLQNEANLKYGSQMVLNEGIHSSTIQLKRSKAVLSKVNLSLHEKRKSHLRSSNISSQKSKENFSNKESQQTSLLNVVKFKMNPKGQQSNPKVQQPAADGQNRIKKKVSKNTSQNQSPQNNNQQTFLTKMKSSREEMMTDSGTYKQSSKGEGDANGKGKVSKIVNSQAIFIQHNGKKLKKLDQIVTQEQENDGNGEENGESRQLDQRKVELDIKKEKDFLISKKNNKQNQKKRARQLNFDLDMNQRVSPLSHVLKEDSTDLLSPFSHELLEYSPRLKITPYKNIEIEQQMLRQGPVIRPVKLKVVDINQNMEQENFINSKGQIPFLPIPQQQDMHLVGLRNQLSPSSSERSIIRNNSRAFMSKSDENVSKSWNFDERLRPYMQIQGLFQGIQSPIEQFENRRIITGSNVAAEMDPQPSPYQSRQYLHDVDETGEMRVMRGIYEVVNQSLEGTSSQVNILKNNMSITSDGTCQQSYPRPNNEQRKKINDRYNQIQKLMRMKKQSSKNSMRMSSVYSSIFKTQDETTSQVCKSQNARSIYQDKMTDNNSQTDTAFVINKSDNQQVNDSVPDVGKQSLLHQINRILSPSARKKRRQILKEDSPDQVGSAEVELLEANESLKGGTMKIEQQ